MHRVKEYFIRIILIVTSLTITLFVLEGLVRLFIPQQLIIIRPDIWIPAETYGWAHAPNLDTPINTGERTTHLITDERGHRITATGPVDDPTYRILAVGDSFTEALAVDQEVSMTGRLQTYLTDELAVPVEVVNTGIAGWGPTSISSKFARN